MLQAGSRGPVISLGYCCCCCLVSLSCWHSCWCQGSSVCKIVLGKLVCAPANAG
jgi:hypothetical protein